MKKYILFIIIIFVASLLSGQYSGASMALADSYLERAQGTDCNYWNPANLYLSKDHKIDLTIINFGLDFNNNALSVKRYNTINGGILTNEIKNDILDEIGSNFYINSTINYTLLGITYRQHALTIGANFAGHSKLDKQYLDLLFYGNTKHDIDPDYIYRFDKKNNSIDGISYLDFTYGVSTLMLDDYIKSLKDKNIPSIRVGFAFSLLSGLAVAETRQFKSTFTNTLDSGINLDQEVRIRTSKGGFGLKTLVGFSSDITEDLTIGITFDNLIGFINWKKDTEEEVALVSIDSVYITNLDDDLFSDTTYTAPISDFQSRLPITLRLGSKYTLSKYSFSLDWKQIMQTSKFYSNQPIVSLGAKYQAFEVLPIRMGFKFGTIDQPYEMAYGLGYENNKFEVNFGMKAYHAIFPSHYSRGYSLAISSKIFF